ncbi:FtsX-like permease family protein [Aliishimia ponticola]|uniref:FtsX-like permease family protein n=1 Tax=Aliishimia ponticola TaxID=2499833 RepID=A0A4S4NCZ7_9RHOB|nr:FtsX-like permease family protein [Aliishimia ponticola]THH37332.1 FtsX-like permease family protein [Aliishimia ponticola]
MARKTAPFAPFEFMIAWRYLKARRAEGGVSVMTWISLIGIALAVFALVATLAVRAGLRAETVKSILGADAHIELHYYAAEDAAGVRDDVIRDYDDLAARLDQVPGVIVAVPTVKGQVIANAGSNNAPMSLYGVTPADLMKIDGVAKPESAEGDPARFSEGLALGQILARDLGVTVGDTVRIISPNGARSPFGTRPRVSAFEVVYIFRSGHGFTDTTRGYLPMAEAQPYLNREGGVDMIDLRLENPEAVQQMLAPVLEAAGPRAYPWTWQDRSGGFLRALSMQDNALYILVSILVLIATMNIISGLIMLVKNKGRDIGILRTMGLTQGSILRVFFLVGALIGCVGTVAGVALGVLFAWQIDTVYSFVDLVSGQSKSALEAQGFFFPPAIIRLSDILWAAGLSLGLSFLVTWFPARRAARMNPVEALRYE